MQELVESVAAEMEAMLTQVLQQAQLIPVVGAAEVVVLVVVVDPVS
jgi:hypothetical protein